MFCKDGGHGASAPLPTLIQFSNSGYSFAISPRLSREFCLERSALEK
jgi:hypothetical protein